MTARVALLLVLSACKADDGRGGGGGDTEPGDPGPTRPYAMVSSGARLVLTPTPRIELAPVDLATDVDAVLIHQEFYGLPWDEFEAGEEPPEAWVAAMDGLLASAGAAPIFLSLQLVSGPGRQFLADRAVITGDDVTTQSAWSTQCYDFATAPDAAVKRDAYIAYVDWMVRRFEPRWVNTAIEMNIFMSCGDTAWSALVEVQNAAYDAAKAALPGVLAFPSIQIDLLYGYTCSAVDRDACYEANYARLDGLKRDRFAVTSFPYLLADLRDPSTLADDWFTRAGDRGDELTVVAETGWLADSMQVLLAPDCIEAIPLDAGDQLTYFEHLMTTVETRGFELVTWVSNRDLMPEAMVSECPCTFDTDWCDFLAAYRASQGTTENDHASAEYGLKTFGSMGLRTYDGVLREGMGERWQAARELPWAGAP